MLEIFAIAKRLHFSIDELKEMTFVSLVNVLISSVAATEREASQGDFDNF